MTNRPGFGRWFATALQALVLAACGGGGGSSSGPGGGPTPSDDGGATAPGILLAAAGIDGVSADTFTLVSSVRVGRTFFDYTYTVRVTNNSGVALQGATATVSSAVSTTVVTDDSLTFGDIAIGASATSSDTFTIRQDRAAPVADANLTVTLSGTPAIPPTSRQLIGKALADGDIDDETALVYEVYAIFGDPRLPAQYKGDDSDVFDSMIMGEVAGRLATLSPANRAILEPFTIPPVYEGSWWQQSQAAAAASPRIQSAGRATPSSIPCPGCPDTLWSNVSQAGGHVKVWWRTFQPGYEAYANQVLNAVEGKIWPELTTLMGREPLSDLLVNNNGGDGLLDIYLLNFTGSAIGLTVAYPFGCKVRPTYVGIDPSRTSKLNSVVAHELMHTIQFTYDVARACTEYDWLGEATAHWAMDFVYPTDNYEQLWADDYLRHPETALGKGADYGAYLLPFYLTRRYVPALVPTIWNNTTQYDSLDAIEHAIPGGFKEQWPDFTLYNWNRDEVHYYRDWDNLSYTTGDLTNMPWRVPKWNGAEPVVLAGDPDKKLPFDRLKNDGQANVSANYYHWVFNDDNVRTVAFYNGFTWDLKEEVDPDLGTHFVPYDWSDPAREKAKVKALIKVGGAWKQQPEDWTERPQQYFCRDRKSERIEELVLIFSNAEHQVQAPGNGKLLPPDQPPTLWLSNMGCYEWKGFADFTDTRNGITETRHAVVTWTPAPNSTYFEARGTIEWHVSGTDAGCTYSGSATVPIETSPAFEKSMETFNDYSDGTLHRSYFGLGYSDETVTETVVCQNDDGTTTTSHDNRDVGTWFPGALENGYKVGAQGNVMDGLFIDLGEGRWDWHFEAQRE